MKEYQTPPYFCEKINRIARNILVFVFPMFSVMCIWTLGNRSILEESSLIKVDSKNY